MDEEKINSMNWYIFIFLKWSESWIQKSAWRTGFISSVRHWTGWFRTKRWNDNDARLNRICLVKYGEKARTGTASIAFGYPNAILGKPQAPPHFNAVSKERLERKKWRILICFCCLCRRRSSINDWGILRHLWCVDHPPKIPKNPCHQSGTDQHSRIKQLLK